MFEFEFLNDFLFKGLECYNQTGGVATTLGLSHQEIEFPTRGFNLGNSWKLLFVKWSYYNIRFVECLGYPWNDCTCIISLHIFVNGAYLIFLLTFL